MNRDRLKQQLVVDEGKRLKPYRDIVGKLTIGIGRNLDAVGISDAEASYLLDNDIDRVIAGLDNKLPWWRSLDDVRQEILANMAFNMGVGGLLGFKRMLMFLRSRDYGSAAAEMRSSLWAEQVGARAKRLADAMETGSPA